LSGTHELLGELSLGHRYRTGFLAFAVMGTLGQAMAYRFVHDRYPAPMILAASALMWGLYGMALGLLIWLVNGGVHMLQTVGMLPGGGLGRSGNILIGVLTSMYFTQPFFTSVFLNLGVVHPFLAALRLGRKAVEIYLAEGKCPGLNRVACAVDWADFIRREVHAVPMFRIPALTIVFMLPQGLWLPTAALVTAVLTALEGLVLRRPPRPENDDAEAVEAKAGNADEEKQIT
jgi:hypothetical protein